MPLLSVADFIGHFHPVWVHLPIGILVLAVLFQWLAAKPRYQILQGSVPLMLLIGGISGAVSCITGFMLSQSGDYDETMVSQHQWLGIITTVLALALYFVIQRARFGASLQRWVSLGLLLLITLTGHWGGSLTHGEDYLLAGLKSSGKGPAIPPIANVQEAVLYKEAVQPLLEARCYSCHGASKMKGKLRLDSEAGIMKGGEDGKSIVPGQAGSSALIERMLLPLNDENHMPPKEKPQLNSQEIALLHWWINTGASFNKKVKDLPQSAEIKPVLAALQTGETGNAKSTADLPAKEVPAPDAKALEALKKTGAIVLPVARSSHYLSVSFITLDSTLEVALSMLAPLRQQIAWLNLGNTALTDKHLAALSGLSNVTRLYLHNTSITDGGLALLKPLTALRYINLTGNGITARGLQSLSVLNDLKSIYLYQTSVSGADFAGLQKIFPNAVIDTGGYRVPTLAMDTTEVVEVKK